MANFTGTAGDDTLTGTSGADTFDISQGGADVVHGQAGQDRIALGGAFDSTDVIDGGDDWDSLSVEGNYGAGLAISDTMMTNIESLQLTGNFVYSLSLTSTARILDVRGDGITGTGHVRFDGSAVTDSGLYFHDSIGSDTLIGGAQDDVFYDQTGGSDVLVGGGHHDKFFMMSGFDGTGFDASDRIDGGAGKDVVTILFGAVDITFDALTIKDIEKLQVDNGRDGFKITSNDGNVSAGKQLEVALLAGSTRTVFDGSAERDGTFKFVEGYGNNTFIGGSQADLFLLETSRGTEVMVGGGGNDVFDVSKGFTAEDRLDGGSGAADTINLSQELRSGMLFGGQTITGIETINITGNYGYRLATNDANVAAGARLTVRTQAATAVVHFDGSAETDGRFTLLGGAADDVMRSGNMKDQLSGGPGGDKLISGAEADILSGGLGGDYLYGGEGNDRFVFADVAESTVASADWIRDWNAGDRIDVWAIDANTGVAGDQAFTFIAAGAFTGAAQLQTRTTAVNTIVSGDIDGDGTADFAVKLFGVQDLRAGSFIL